MDQHILYSYSVEQLEKLIRDCIKSELKNHVPATPFLETKFISRKTTASLLRISLGTLNDYCKRGIIPTYRIGSKVLFIESQVIASVSQVKAVKHKKGGLDL